MDFFQALSVYFVWHPLDEENVRPLIEHCYQLLSKNVEKPFSRSMNLPVFFRTSCTCDVPEQIITKSEKTIAFLFVSKEVVVDEKWIEYLKSISANASNRLIVCNMQEIFVNNFIYFIVIIPLRIRSNQNNSSCPDIRIHIFKHICKHIKIG
ncbi:hypothetical protein [Anaerotignum propionicum]|uniref:hypothetical protein n=1 Tax=Anaerotignum propionicum TaxID=28446 RepID=UPI002ED5176C